MADDVQARYHAYTALTTTFNVALASVAFRHQVRERFEEGVPWGDLALLGVATHKVGRLITKEKVTKPIRAHFTEERPGMGERPAGGGLRRAVGELLTCPYCTAPWIALGLSSLYLVRPAAARFVAGLFSMVTLSDYLNNTQALMKGSQAAKEAQAQKARVDTERRAPLRPRPKP